MHTSTAIFGHVPLVLTDAQQALCGAWDGTYDAVRPLLDELAIESGVEIHVVETTLIHALHRKIAPIGFIQELTEPKK